MKECLSDIVQNMTKKKRVAMNKKLFRELVYAGADVRTLCGKEYPDAVITNTSGRGVAQFSITGDISMKEFYIFATREDFVASCLGFMVETMCCGENPAWAETLDAIDTELRRLSSHPDQGAQETD